MQDRIASIIAEYDAQGIHRTGTEVDAASAALLVARIRALDIEAGVDTFEFRRLDVIDARFRFAGMDVPGVPLYDCTYTDDRGIGGTVGEVGSGADIGIAMTPPTPRGDVFQRIEAARRQHSHAALVLVTDETMPADGVATVNAEAFRNPYGPPVVQIPNTRWPRIREAMAKGEQGTVIARCRYTDAAAGNVQARIAGRDPDLAPLVIMTPRSGWWSCASERGGGIAAFLEMMRAIRRTGAGRDVLFTANTGHELGHTGLDHYLSANPGLIKGAHLWIHLGANFAAKYGAGVRLQYSDEAARTMALAHAGAQSVQPATETPTTVRPFGEARNIHDGGGRFVSILGSNGRFHHPSDVWPDAVDIDATTRWVRAFSNMATELAGGVR